MHSVSPHEPRRSHPDAHPLGGTDRSAGGGVAVADDADANGSGIARVEPLRPTSTGVAGWWDAGSEDVFGSIDPRGNSSCHLSIGSTTGGQAGRRVDLPHWFIVPVSRRMPRGGR